MSTMKPAQGSAVNREADAIVNAANKYLAAGSGICGAIFAAAGNDALRQACAGYASPLRDGEAVITPAFGITNAKAIIHAVGPDFGVTPGAFKALQDAYYNSLMVLMQNGLHSIAFPLISAGIYGGNLPNPVAVSAKAVGQSHGKIAMYRVKSGEMSKAGYKFYLSVNGVWLTKTVPPEYLERLY